MQSTDRVKIEKSDDGYFIKIVEGIGSKLNADFLDDKDSTFFTDAENIVSGLLSSDRFSAWGDLTSEGFVVDGKIRQEFLEATTSSGSVDLTGYATQSWVNSQGYITSYTETDPTLSTWNGTTSVNTVGTITTGTWNASPITSTYIQDGTIQLSDIAQNSCTDGEIMKWNNTSTSWECAVDNGAGLVDWSGITNRPAGLDDGDDDTHLTEGEVETYITNAAIDLATGSTVNTQTIATESWVTSQGYVTIDTDTHLTEGEVETYITNGALNLFAGTTLDTAAIATQPWVTSQSYITASSIDTLTNKSGNISQWTNDSGYVTTSDDTVSGTELDGTFTTNGILTRTGAETYSTTPNNSTNWDTAYSWGNHSAAGYVTPSSVDTFTNKSGNISQWTNDSGYLTGYTETDPGLATFVGTSNITTIGTITTGTWNGTPITSTYIQDGTIALGDIAQNSCTDGQVMKWSDTSTAWVCAADDNDGSSGGSGTGMTFSNVAISNYVYASNQTTTSSTYSTINGSEVIFTKYTDDSDVLIDIDLSMYANVANTGAQIAVSDGTTDYDVFPSFINVSSNHVPFSGKRFIEALPAGDYTFSIKWKRTFGTGTLTIDSNDAVIMSVSEVNGSGTTAVYQTWDPDAPPETASAYDDEFEDESLDVTKWSEYDHAGTLTLLEEVDGLNMYVNQDSSYSGVYQTIPSAGDFTITTKLSQNGARSDALLSGLALYEDPTNSASKIYLYLFRYSSSNNYGFTTQNCSSYNNCSSVSQLNSALTSSSAYLRVRRSGSTYYYDISTDGLSWEQLFSNTLGYTPTHFGLVSRNNNTSEIQTRAAFDFFRYQNSDVGVLGRLNGRMIDVGGSGITAGGGTSIPDWADIQNIPADIADGDDVLDESTVESYITNGAIDLDSTSTIGAELIASQTWVGTQGYITDSSIDLLTNKTGSNSQWTNDEGYITADSTDTLTNKSGDISQWTNDSGYLTNTELNAFTGTANLATVGTITSGTWNGDAITSTFIQDGTIALGDIGQNSCTDGQVLKWSDLSTGWICAADDNSGGTGGGETAINYQIANGTTDVSTTSTTWVDMPDMSVTMDTTGGPVEINFSAGVGADTNSAETKFRILIDGVQRGNVTNVRTPAASIGPSANLTWIEELTAASHTIKIQWKTLNGTSLNRPAAEHENRTLTVKEYAGSSSAVYSKWDPDAPPETASAYDDEFSGTSLDPKWDTTNGTGAISIGNQYLQLNDSRYIFQNLPAGDFSIWTKLTVSGRPSFANYNYSYIAVQQGTGTLFTIGLTSRNTNINYIEVVKFNNWFSWNSTPVGINVVERNFMYASIRRSGSTLSFWVSQDGINYNMVYAVADPGSTRMGILNYGSGSNTLFDYFRYTNSYKDQLWHPEGRVIDVGGSGGVGGGTSTPDWADIQNIPADIADGDDDTQLSEAEVETYVTNGALNLFSGTTLNSESIATESWVTSQSYLTAETDPTLSTWIGSGFITTVGTITSGVWNG